jgi:hypothetical protein
MINNPASYIDPTGMFFCCGDLTGGDLQLNRGAALTILEYNRRGIVPTYGPPKTPFVCGANCVMAKGVAYTNGGRYFSDEIRACVMMFVVGSTECLPLPKETQDDGCGWLKLTCVLEDTFYKLFVPGECSKFALTTGALMLFGVLAVTLPFFIAATTPGISTALLVVIAIESGVTATAAFGAAAGVGYSTYEVCGH